MKKIAFLLLGFACAAFSLVYTPRVVVDGQPDFYSLETIVQGIIKPGMSPAQKAEAVWRFVLANTFHYKSADEVFFGYYENTDWKSPFEALKILNCYGYCYCYSNVSVMQRLWEAANFDSTRIWGIGGHLVAEVYYDGGWHYYDGDQSVSAYFLMPDGKTVASCTDVQDQADALILNPRFRSNPSMPYKDHPFYFHESPKVLADYYKGKDDNYIRDIQSQYYHKMDYYLHKGESITLFFDKQGRWRHNGMDWHLTNPGSGPYDVHGNRTYSNGVFEYQPDLKDPSILTEGFFSSSNILANGTLTLADSGRSGEFIIKTMSPWVITGTPVGASSDVSQPVRYAGAALLSGRLEGAGPEHFTVPLQMDVSISTDNMLGEFKPVFSQNACGCFNVDLSEHLATASYYYLVKVVLKGKGPGVKAVPFLDTLRLKTWVQVNPSSIPRLEPGRNKVRYSVDGPRVDKVDIRRSYVSPDMIHYPLFTQNVAMAKKGSLSRTYLQKDTLRPAVLVFDVDAKEGDIYDYTLLANPAMREGMAMDIFRSENDSTHWIAVPYRKKLHHDHWAHQVTQTFTASPAVRKVYFKFVLSGGASLVMANFSYRYKYRVPSGTVFAIHGVEVDGKMKEFRNDLKGEKGAYKVTVNGKKIVNKFLRYECK